MIEKSPYYYLLEYINARSEIIDMHLHTNSSYGDEHNQMGITPVEVLDDFAIFSNETNRKITFSITDHNSFIDLRKVVQKLENDKINYKNITFIPGCEFTVHADSLGQYKRNNGNLANISSNFHMLAYNFNIYDERLSYYSSLLDDSNFFIKKDGIKFSYGVYILAIRKLLKNYNIDLELLDFKNFKFDMKCTLSSNINNLIKYTLSLKYNDVVISNLINKDKFEDKFKTYIDDVQNLVKCKYLDVYELMEYVEDAGGFCVLAHPKIFLWSLVNLDNVNFNFEENKKFANFQISDLLEYCINKLCDPNKIKQNGEKLKGVVGLEVFHPTSFKSYIYDKMCHFVDKYGLFVTAGSDSHYQINPKSVPCSVIANKFEKYTKQKNNIPFSKECNYAVSYLKIVDFIKSNKKIERSPSNKMQDCKIHCAVENKELNYRDISNMIQKITELARTNNNSTTNQKKSNKKKEKFICQI